MAEKFKVPRKITPDAFYRDFLPEFVETHLAGDPDFRKIAISATIELTGDEELGGRWSLRLADGVLETVDDAAFTPEVVVEQSVEDWREALRESNGTPLSEIRKRLSGAARTVEAFKRLSGTLLVEITREDEAPWRVRLRTGRDVETPGAETAISLPDYDYDDIREGRADPLQLLLRGKIKVRGDRKLAREFVTLANHLEG